VKQLEHRRVAVLEPIPVAAFSRIPQQGSVSGSPTGSPIANDMQPTVPREQAQSSLP
jgi:hypothetical protein